MPSLLRCLICLSVSSVLVATVLACQTSQSHTDHQSMQPPETVFPLAELNKNPDLLDAMFQAIMRGQKAIIKIDKDYIFPLIFDLKNKAAEIDLNNNTIELSFNRDMFLSISKEAAKVSLDGRDWYDIKDLKALKQLMKYRKGTLAFSVSANTGDTVAFIMTISTDAE